MLGRDVVLLQLEKEEENWVERFDFIDVVAAQIIRHVIRWLFVLPPFHRCREKQALQVQSF